MSTVHDTNQWKHIIIIIILLFDYYLLLYLIIVSISFLVSLAVA